LGGIYTDIPPRRYAPALCQLLSYSLGLHIAVWIKHRYTNASFPQKTKSGIFWHIKRNILCHLTTLEYALIHNNVEESLQQNVRKYFMHFPSAGSGCYCNLTNSIDTVKLYSFIFVRNTVDNGNYDINAVLNVLGVSRMYRISSDSTGKQQNINRKETFLYDYNTTIQNRNTTEPKHVVNDHHNT